MQERLATMPFCMNHVHPSSWLPARCMIAAVLDRHQDLMYCHDCFNKSSLRGTPAPSTWFCYSAGLQSLRCGTISANICVTARSAYPDSTLGCELVGSKQETWVDHHTISPLSRPCRHDFQALGLSVNLSEGPDFAKSNCLWCTCVAMSLLLILWTKSI